MDSKSSAVLGVSIVVASFILGITLRQDKGAAPVQKQDQVAASVEAGRFHIATMPKRVFVLDTATGQVWVNIVDESVTSSSSMNSIDEIMEPKLNTQPETDSTN